MATLFEVYKNSVKKLENPNKDEINIRLFLCEINNLKSMSEFYLKKDENILDLQRFNEYFQRYQNGEPIEYILNKTEFFGSHLYIDNRVLIPRQETEEVACYALRQILKNFPNQEVSLVDVCCGSGCLGISLAKHLPIENLYLSDISQDACDVAAKNLALNELTGYVLHGDGLEPFIRHNIKVDVLVANPPYILNRSEVDDSVLNYEPHLALFADSELSVYRGILQNAEKIMNDKLLIVFEIGYDIKDKIIEILQELEIDGVFTFRKDINDKFRIFSVLLERKIESC